MHIRSAQNGMLLSRRLLNSLHLCYTKEFMKKVHVSEII